MREGGGASLFCYKTPALKTKPRLFATTYVMGSRNVYKVGLQRRRTHERLLFTAFGWYMNDKNIPGTVPRDEERVAWQIFTIVK